MRFSTAAHSSGSITSARSRYSSSPSGHGSANRSASWAGVGRALSRMRASADEPVDIPSESFLQGDSRLEAELTPRPANVGHERPGVAFPIVLDDLGRAPGRGANRASELVHGGRDAGRDIVRPWR